MGCAGNVNLACKSEILPVIPEESRILGGQAEQSGRKQ